MEGVVLYVKLVGVFITHHKCYIAFFTIASYGKQESEKYCYARLTIMVYSGIPLLYMILVAPLGLLVNTEDIVGSHYGRRNAESK